MTARVLDLVLARPQATSSRRPASSVLLRKVAIKKNHTNHGSREGKGLGSKGQSCTLEIGENSRSADEKNRISAEKLWNNINNCRNGVETKVEKQAWSIDRTWESIWKSFWSVQNIQRVRKCRCVDHSFYAVEYMYLTR